jgi:dihydrofolate synthase / folylpolyglutamate synthase
VRYADAIERLFALQSRGIRLGASRMQAGLALRGHPERGQRFVHVAGTNGKGSVSAMVAACLQRAGYRTGLYTSPHLHRYVERVRIDGRPIAEREATRRIVDLLACFDRSGAPETTFFELTTLLALEAFRDHRCDLVVLEVGLGGRLDATNAVTPEVSVITRIALDHTQILGDSLAQIAREKAGIAKRGVPLIVGAREPEALAVIARCARRVRAPLSIIDRDFAVTQHARGDRFDVRVGERVFGGLRTLLPGAHQLDNAACAVAALAALDARGISVPERALRAGLAGVRWPGRLERVRGRPRFLFDAAHNADGCAALARFLREQDARSPRGRARRALIFGVMADKQYASMLRMLAPLCDRVFFSQPKLRRAASAAKLRKVTRGVATRDIADALARAKRAVGPSGEVVIAGSVFVVAEARARVLGLRSDPLIRM